MKLPIVIVAIYVSAVFSYAIIEVGSYVEIETESDCESYDFLHEMSIIPKFDSAKHSMVAKYCLLYHDNVQGDTAMSFSLYEQIIPLAVKIQKECHSHSVDGKIYLEPIKMFFGGLYGGWSFCTDASIPPKENYICKTDINEHYNIYKYIKGFGIDYCFNKVNNISYLLGKYFPIKWELTILCDDEEIPIPVPKSYYIYISGICNEDQLKKIEEIKKNDK
jgi:hypothetical protein